MSSALFRFTRGASVAAIHVRRADEDPESADVVTTLSAPNRASVEVDTWFSLPGALRYAESKRSHLLRDGWLELHDRPTRAC